MDLDLSDEWTDLMEKENVFYRALSSYTQTVEPERQKYDLLISLGDEAGALVALRLIKEGYISVEDQPMVCFKLIQLVFGSDLKAAEQATDILSSLSDENKMKNKSDYVRITNDYTEDTDEELKLLFAVRLLVQMGFGDEAAGFIRRHNKVLQMSDDEIEEFI